MRKVMNKKILVSSIAASINNTKLYLNGFFILEEMEVLNIIRF